MPTFESILSALGVFKCKSCGSLYIYNKGGNAVECDACITKDIDWDYLDEWFTNLDEEGDWYCPPHQQFYDF